MTTSSMRVEADRRSASEPVSASGRPSTPRLVGWHVRLGETALRLFLLNVLWLLGTLAGAVIIGLFPASGAVHAILRRDATDRRQEDLGFLPPSRPSLWQEFWQEWRAGLRSANMMGLVFGLAWTVLIIDRAVVTRGVGSATPWVSGVVVVITVLLATLTLIAWPVLAQFDEKTPRILKLTFVLALSRPLLTVFVALVASAWIWLAGSAPGICVVFGIALPAWVTTTIYWHSGVFQDPNNAPDSAHT